ncbi:hypothetical protein HDV00_000845 [Rhizophlyctis rosea]|nr:hypothetical protein HDV00_000845 [Rhizophlyctis rosea]
MLAYILLLLLPLLVHTRHHRRGTTGHAPLDTFAPISAVTTALSTTSQLVSCLQKAGITTITPSSSSYNTARFGHDKAFNYKPVAIAYPTTDQQVASAVKCAVKAGVKVAPRSGGHSYEGYSMGGMDGSLIVDVTTLKSISVSNGYATVGAGNRLGPIALALSKSGVAVPAGTCPSVGVGGHALGGGFGVVGRKYGMLSDNIKSIRFVSAASDLLTVNQDTNSDLFWALRGAGGGNFGIVTSFKFKTFAPPSEVTTFAYTWDAKDYQQVMSAYMTYAATASRDVSFEINWSGPDGGFEMDGTYLGPKSQLSSVLKALLQAMPTPTSTDIQEGAYIDSILRWAWMKPGSKVSDLALGSDGNDLSKTGDARYYGGKSLIYLSPLTSTTLTIMSKHLSSTPSAASAAYIIMDIWAGAVQDGSPYGASAFPHNDVKYSIEFVVEWDGPGACAACEKWIGDFVHEMYADYVQEYGRPVRAYSNYIDRSLPDWQTAYYGDNYSRLQDIKKQWDPSNVFSFPQSIQV